MKNFKRFIFMLNFSLFFVNASFSQNITADTTLANQYFNSARTGILSQKLDSIDFYLDKAQPLYIKHLGENSLQNTKILHLKGILNYYTSKYDVALSFFLESLKIKKELFGESNTLVVDSYKYIGAVYYQKSEFDKALEYSFKSLAILRALVGEKHIEIAALYNNIGTYYSDKCEYERALEFHYKSLTIKKEIQGEKNSGVGNSYNNIGTVYLDKSEYDKALDYFFKSLTIRIDLFGETDITVAYSYNSIGTAYFCKSEYNKALDYFLKSLIIKKELLGEKKPEVANSINNIGNVFTYQEEFDKALEYYLKGLSIRIELFGEKNVNVASSYLNIGNVYNKKTEYDNALEYFVKSSTIFKEVQGERNIPVAKSYSNIGEVYFEKYEYDKALEYYHKSLEINKEILSEKNPGVARSYYNIGLILTMKKYYPIALKYYQKGVASCLRNFNDTSNVNIVPFVANYLDWNDLLDVLQAKAQIFASDRLNLQDINKFDALKIALSHYQACDTLIDFTRKEITSLSDKLALGEKANKIYNEAIAVCLKLSSTAKSGFDSKSSPDFYLREAFYFSEKNKSSVLLQALAGQEAQKFAGIPDSLLEKEHKLKIDIAFYTKQLATPENLDSAKSILFQNKLFMNNRSYESLIVTFEKQFPEYFALKYNNKVVPVETLQKTALNDGKTALVSYVVGDSTISIFTITKKTFDVQQLPKPKDLTDSIEYFRNSLTYSSTKYLSAYKRMANNLYNLLIPKNLDKKIENLIIIPDNILSTIPFETLLTKEVNDSTQFKDLPYFVRDYNISYSYSATLFNRTYPKEKTKNIEITPLKDWIAFAPIFSDFNSTGSTIASRELIKQLRNIKKDSTSTRGILFSNGDYIPPLPGSEDEVKNIFNQFDELKYKAEVELHNNASEQFIKLGGLQDYKMIHFATHGFVNSENPELSGLLLAQDTTGGQDGILFSGEIFNLKLKSDLVVLSACETGLGKIKEGEGIIGLTRALLYAGAKNIIVSLWQVNDESTSGLMIDFYKKLLKNIKKQNYSECLRQAKLKMIDEGKFAHPYYWSPFILIGK